MLNKTTLQILSPGYQRTSETEIRKIHSVIQTQLLCDKNHAIVFLKKGKYKSNDFWLTEWSSFKKKKPEK